MAVREKTITWEDPLATAEAGRELSGLEYMTGIVEGRFPQPPIAAHFGMTLKIIGPGDVIFAATPDESLYNPIGMVHGGVAATMLDSAIGCAVHTTLPAGVGYTSVELKVNFLRAIHGHTGEIRAHGWVVKPGSRIAFAEADLRDADGKLLATASSTCLIMKP
ncbi:PaaI family thioesterase [Amycolatopsis sp. NPDC059657]|uniref:PaaI family thioesterase n=1 Tax=Amycolatopsis sp. NPDC059657 TaxID=3346899 RepID=UPI00366FF235